MSLPWREPQRVAALQSALAERILIIDGSPRIADIPTIIRDKLDLHRFRSGLLRAILAIKETGYGSNTQR